MADTITTYTTFVAGTKARASEVNGNLSNHRGTLVPVNTDTQTASNNTHDLGTSDHQWRRLYLQQPPLVGGVQLGRLNIDAVYDASNPTDMVENDSWLNRMSFPKSVETGIAFSFVVPPDYVSGNRMSIAIRGYCETATSAFVLESGSALYKPSITSASATAPANVLTTTANVTPAIAGVMLTSAALHITGATGLINSLTVTAGDVIACYIKRRGDSTSDTNTGYFHLTNVYVDLNT